MSKFNEMYPSATKGFRTMSHDNFPPVQKYECGGKEAGCDGDHACICGEQCTWVNDTAMQFVCSTECNKKVWDNLFTAFVAGQLMGSL